MDHSFHHPNYIGNDSGNCADMLPLRDEDGNYRAGYRPRDNDDLNSPMLFMGKEAMKHGGYSKWMK